MMVRSDTDGVWRSIDGVSWSLVEPSPLFDALRQGVRNPDGSVTVDNGDGTGIRTTFDEDGTVVSVEELSGLPIPTPPEPTDAEKIAALQQQLDALLDALGGE